MRHVIAAGSGPVLLCLHGIGGSALTFRPQLERLGDRFHVVARDAPGYAAAPDPDAYPGVTGYVEEAASVIDAVGGAPAYVLGMSWGGVIAMELALRRPELVRGLILGDSTRGSGRSVAQARAMLTRAEELRSVGAEEFARRRARRLLRPGAPDGEVAQVAEAMAAAIRLPGYGHAARFMAEADLSDRLSRIEVPTLVIYGAGDRVTGEPESSALHAGITGSHLVRIENAGHLANQENPAAFNAAVHAFAARH